jgi:hypothetical protein
MHNFLNTWDVSVTRLWSARTVEAPISANPEVSTALFLTKLDDASREVLEQSDGLAETALSESSVMSSSTCFRTLTILMLGRRDPL